MIISENKRIRKTLSLLIAILAYYLIHEGAHLIFALFTGSCKSIRFMGLIGMQIEIEEAQMSNLQLGLFCLAGPLATLIVAWILTRLTPRICASSSIFFRAIMYYATLVLLCLDPIYLSILFRFVGGGDMNGISLLIPQSLAVLIFALLLLLNLFLFFKKAI